METTVQLFKALADETRLRILSLLLSEGELCVCDIISALDLPQSTVSRHLAHLRRAGWVNDRRCGIWVYYSIREKDASRKELIPFLRRHLVGTSASATDRELLESIGKGSRCV